MDFFNRLLNGPSPKPAICHGSPTRQHRESAGEATLPSSRPQSEPDHLIRFSRDFSEAASGSSGPSSLVPESLSSASSFQSIASTLSSKSSSGICADSAPGSPDKVITGNGFDHSYVNVNIPDLDDLISACANINLNNATSLEEAADENRVESADSSEDLSQDQTFTSAADDTIADETQLIAEEAIQTFGTCPPIREIQVTKVTSTENPALKVPPLPIDEQSSVIPYLSFEESVLRKHQGPAEDGAEFKSALTSFPARQPLADSSTVDIRRRSCSPTPCEEIDVAQLARLTCTSPKNLDATLEKKEEAVEQDYPLGTPDASFQEVQAFNSTVVLNTDPTDDPSTEESKASVSLNNTVVKTSYKSEVAAEKRYKPVLSFDELPVGLNTKDSEVIQEATASEANKTQDIIPDPNLLNKTQDILQDTKVLNKTQDVVEDTRILNETQDIVQEENVRNKTQDIVEKESNVTKAEFIKEVEKNAANENQVIVQEINSFDKKYSVQNEKQTLEKVDDLVGNKEILKQTIELSNEIDEKLITSQKKEPVSPKGVEFKTPQKVEEEIFLKPEAKTPKQPKTAVKEEPQNLNDTKVISSTPLPDKNLNKANTTESPKPKSTLFINESAVLSRSAEIKEEKNKLNFDQTLVINKSLEKSSLSASELTTDLETNTNVSQENLFNLPTYEPEYEAFKPVQQSTNLPFIDLKKVQEAALAVAKDIDESLEKIDETEHFVSATTDLFEDPSALDFLTHVGSQKPPQRGERYDSLYMKFDPLAQRLSMLPQKNLPTSQTVDAEEQKEKETKTDAPLNEMGTPKKNPALAAIDRLLFYSPSTQTESAVAEAKQKKEEEEKQVSPVVPVIDEKMAIELELVRSTVLQLESELEKQKQEHKEQLEKLKGAYEEKVNHMQTKFSQMQSQLSQEVKCKGQMTVVVEEYEKTISRLIAEREKDRSNFEVEIGKLQEELQVASQHLTNTEAAFSDVHSKYERLKNVVSAYKSNEMVLKESIAENQETVKTLESKYEQMKSHAVAQLEKANMELNSIRKQNEAETVKLKALVRKAELKSKSLAETVEQKIKENKELTQIIDEMIARVD